ncbi:MAG: DUF72 domain-containing protein [Gammaproteobacteria bacterium]|nr:MAG: DUF72 domain-containing protein [Gammaproteobacteria bacterium]
MARSIEIRAGTSGYSYKEWRGAFYPSELHSDEWLSYYASRLPAVEINNTFYRMPRSHVVETWRDSVPDDFRFVIKASRRITHQKRLKDVEEPMGFLLGRAEILGGKLGALLFQLPPNMSINAERLRSFQALIPKELPVAFEFRHPSWQDEAVYEALSERGHALVVTHDDSEGAREARALELLPGPLTYLRLRGSSYAPAALRRWRDKVLASSSERAFVFFKHEDDGGGARMAEAFLSDSASPARAPRKKAARKSALGAVPSGSARRGPKKEA